MPGNINFSKFWAFVGILVPPLSMASTFLLLAIFLHGFINEIHEILQRVIRVNQQLHRI